MCEWPQPINTRTGNLPVRYIANHFHDSELSASRKDEQTVGIGGS